MSELKLGWKYLVLIFKNWVIWITLFISIVGVIITYFTEFKIPQWVLYSLPYLALIFSGFEIFKKSSPKISIKKPSEKDFELYFDTVDDYSKFNFNLKTYIENYGLQSGSLEGIEVKFKGVNNVTDDFILNSMDISSGNILVTDGPSVFSSAGGKLLGYPMILKPDTLIPIYIYIPIKLSYFSSKADDKLKWANKFHFELEYKFKDIHGTEVKKIPFNLKVDNLFELKEEEVKKREYEGI